jgi:hypothetical protein
MTKKPTIIERVDEIHSSYSNNTTLRAGVTLIPYIGGALDVLFSHKGQEIMNERIESAFQKVKDEAQKLDESKIDYDFLESEEFFDIVYRTFDEIRKTRLKEKHKLFARILAKSTLNTNKSFEINKFQNILSSIDIEDIFVAQYLINNKDKVESSDHDIKNNFWKEMNIDGLSNEELQMSLNTLFALGLITERYGAAFDYSGGHYKISKLLKEFLVFIKEVEE